MPKNKTHKGIAKRIKVSASGKLLRQRAGKSHLLEHKPTKQKRRLSGISEVARNDTRRVRRMLGR